MRLAMDPLTSLQCSCELCHKPAPDLRLTCRALLIAEEVAKGLSYLHR